MSDDVESLEDMEKRELYQRINDLETTIKHMVEWSCKISRRKAFWKFGENPYITPPHETSYKFQIIDGSGLGGCYSKFDEKPEEIKEKVAGATDRMKSLAEAYKKNADILVACSHCGKKEHKNDALQTCVKDNAAYFIAYVCRACQDRIIQQNAAGSST